MIKPLYNNILIKPQSSDMPLGSEGLLTEIGTVLDVGSEVKDIKVGDVLAFSKWGVKHVEMNNEKYYFIPEDGRFVLGKLSMSG